MSTKIISSQQEWLEKVGFSNKQVFWNLTPEELHQHSLDNNHGVESSTGALAISTGKFTGRSPQDRFIVKDQYTADKIWWGKVNIPFEAEKYEALKAKLLKHLGQQEKLYIRDAEVCASHKYVRKVRVVNEKPWGNQFAFNMFREPTSEVDFGTSEWTIFNAPTFEADPAVDGTRQANFAILSVADKTIIIGGTGYTGEMKKGMFSALNFMLPTEDNVFPMHASANVGEKGDTAIFFGLSGTGKTTLSADPNRKLIGDDEHGWTPEGDVFNFEGGCYAKAIDLSEETEPDIFRAIKKGAILENIVFKEGTNEVDYSDTSITQNTRVSYPLSHINNIQPNSTANNARNIFFLTADAFGVLPPISKLTPEQAAYFFVSGYTAKVAGTEEGINEPTPSFSACFGAPFMPLHPFEYAEMLQQKMKQFDTNVWLINTGWIGGPYGVGNRIKLKFTRAMITAAMNGGLDKVEYKDHSHFHLAVPQSCPEVPTEKLNPELLWEDIEAYNKQAEKLVKFFQDNYKTFEEGGNDLAKPVL